MSDAQDRSPIDSKDPQERAVFHCTVADWILGFEVENRRGNGATRRNLYIIATLVVAVLFVPEVVADVTNPISWIMCVLMIGFMLFVWKYPEIQNKKFAEARVKNAPESTLYTSLTQVSVKDAQGEEVFLFNAQFRVVDYQDVLVLLGERGRVYVLPGKQLSPETLESVRSLLRRQLGERYEKPKYLRGGLLLKK